ncbi:MAG: hypothetical protein D6713_02825 [Deltaproteobacteria bacterium]|nr:MAG: hypothetical protein D6713_02825 [Deltaproteobacteria bacterium]
MPGEQNFYRESATDSEIKTVYIIYALLLAGLVIGITGIIGVIGAYIYRGDLPPWLETHIQNQIRTFWGGFLIFLVSIPLMMILVGYPLLVAGIIWYIVRCVKGLKCLNQRQPYPKPDSWGF